MGLGGTVGFATIAGLGNAAVAVAKFPVDDGPRPASWQRIGRIAAVPVALGGTAYAIERTARLPKTVGDAAVDGALISGTALVGLESVRAFNPDATRAINPSSLKFAGKAGIVGGALMAEAAVARPLMKVPDSAAEGATQGAVAGAMTGTALLGARWLFNQKVPIASPAGKVAALGALYAGQVGFFRNHLELPKSSIDGSLTYGILGAPVIGGTVFATRAILAPAKVFRGPVKPAIGFGIVAAAVGGTVGAVGGALAGSEWISSKIGGASK
jgi:hypothetical protein